MFSWDDYEAVGNRRKDKCGKAMPMWFNEILFEPFAPYN